jgi:hypothetical protein
MNSFCEGLDVEYKNFSGKVRFITDAYLTICVEIGETKLNDVCVVVYRSDWKKIRISKESGK